MSDHPRACGANHQERDVREQGHGSSPRMRGKLGLSRLAVVPRRIIPAHAGQTPDSGPCMVVGTDHPRACGANTAPPNFITRKHGSSPRMRGKPVRCQPCVLPFRIIPAHAGQTNRSRTRRPSNPDHPRACGANSAYKPGVFEYLGSSPRMRGKPPGGCNGVRVFRIIPAHAGQTPPPLFSRGGGADHPRACGANLVLSFIIISVGGSSPRMRGKHIRTVENAVKVRIIPAHAGQTGLLAQWLERHSDHPRACGANVSVVWVDLSVCGSSPRMRGKLGGGAGLRTRVRIIPAHAGQTPPDYASYTVGPDHPRACGANLWLRPVT